MKLRGRDADFHEYFAAERVALQRFAGFLTGDPAAAADLAQEAFVRLYQRWGSLDRDPGPLSAANRRQSDSQRTPQGQS